MCKYSPCNAYCCVKCDVWFCVRSVNYSVFSIASAFIYEKGGVVPKHDILLYMSVSETQACTSHSNEFHILTMA